MSTYVFDQTWQQEHDRLRALEELLDAASQRHLAGLGLGPGWRCLEIGCGAGSVARWLAGQVGPSGQVLATDLDPRFMDGHGLDNLEVRRHDILVDPLPQGHFDLAHARAVLMHLPQRQRALARMVAAVRPGGWVVAEDVDLGGAMLPALVRYVDPPEHAGLWQRLGRSIEALFAAAGADAGFAARLPGALAQAGLEEVGAELHAPLLRGGVERDFYRLSVEHLGAPLVAAGLLSHHELQQALAACADPALRHLPFVVVTAWGRRPEGTGSG